MNSNNQVDNHLLKKRRDNLKDYLRSVRKKRSNNSVYLGELKQRCGLCRHRSTLCKVVCDELGIRCRLICVAGYHAWNVIWIKDKFFIVDLMNYNYKLIKLDEQLEYKKTKEYMSFYQLQKRNVLDMFENRRKPKEYESILKTLEVLIVNEEIRMQRENFFKGIFEEKDGSTGPNIMKQLDIKKGGFGRISKFVVEETKELEDKSLVVQNLKMIGDSEKVVLFTKGEKISVKQIPILEDGEEELENVVNVTNIREGMQRKYALKEKNFMRILDHSYIIKSLGSFEFEDINHRKHLCILMNSMERDGDEFLSLLRREPNSDMNIKRKLIEVLYFLVDANQGLQYMHRMNIIHMDFKLENIMVDWDPLKKEFTRLKIIDFGGAKETDYRTSTAMFTTNINDSPEVIIQKRRRNVKRVMVNLKKRLNENGGGKVTEENSMEVNERIDEILASLVEGIPRIKFKETPKVLARSLRDEIEFVLRLEVDYKDFTVLDDNKKHSLRETMKKVRKEEQDQESSLLRIDERADVFSYGKIIETILKNVRTWSTPKLDIKRQKEKIVKDLRNIMDACLKEKKEDRPTMEGIMVALLIRLYLTVCH